MTPPALEMPANPASKSHLASSNCPPRFTLEGEGAMEGVGLAVELLVPEEVRVGEGLLLGDAPLEVEGVGLAEGLSEVLGVPSQLLQHTLRITLLTVSATKSTLPPDIAAMPLGALRAAKFPGPSVRPREFEGLTSVNMAHVASFSARTALASLKKSVKDAASAASPVGANMRATPGGPSSRGVALWLLRRPAKVVTSPVVTFTARMARAVESEASRAPLVGCHARSLRVPNCAAVPAASTPTVLVLRQLPATVQEALLLVLSPRITWFPESETKIRAGSWCAPLLLVLGPIMAAEGAFTALALKGGESAKAEVPLPSTPCTA